jgi:hypothetical protein
LPLLATPAFNWGDIRPTIHENVPRLRKSDPEGTGLPRPNKQETARRLVLEQAVVLSERVVRRLMSIPSDRKRPADLPYKHIWVGMLPSTGALIVFDPEIQLPGQTDVCVYSVSRDLVRRFDPAEIRGQVRTVKGAARENAIAKYIAWKAAHGREFLRNEPKQLATEEHLAAAERATIVERHRTFLESSGRNYQGVIESRSGRVRLTHCWRCKEDLDNRVDIECAACHWIICTCGACGCQ